MGDDIYYDDRTTPGAKSGRGLSRLAGQLERHDVERLNRREQHEWLNGFEQHGVIEQPLVPSVFCPGSNSELKRCQ